MIYHIAAKSEWQMATASGLYEAESLISEGFLHCSTEEHVMQVANFYFKGRADLVLLEIEETKVKAEIKWEQSGEHEFPHVYGPLEISAVEQVAYLKVNDDGEFEFPFKRVLH